MLNLMIALMSLQFSYAQVFGPSATEVKFSYEAQFMTDELESYLEEHEEFDSKLAARKAAEYHNSHLFGLFQSEQFVKSFGLNYEFVGGVGAVKIPVQITGLKLTDTDQGFLISYKATGKILLHNTVANKLLEKGSVTLPLPYLIDGIYNRACTDSHYPSREDYWYFYDVFRQGCTYLQDEPYAKMTDIAISESVTRTLDMDPRLDLLRGNNGNGDVFRMDLLFGFAESADDNEDEGRVNFLEITTYLEELKFKKKVIQNDGVRIVFLYRGNLLLENGKRVEVEVKTSLVDTEIEARTVKFAKLFKDAVENADVVVYMGHSGLGGNLDIPSLEQKAGGFEFNAKKRQIFYFDSCASYSYYLESFRKMKTRSKLDVITNGLSSYFSTSGYVLQNLIESLLSPQVANHSWEDILGKMEEPLDGGSYLVNVGGI